MLQRPSSTDQLVEYFAQLQQLRESRPVFYDETTASWQVFRYKEVVSVLTDAAHFAMLEGGHTTPAPAQLDAVAHQRLRTLLEQATFPRAVTKLTPRLTAMGRELLDRVRPAGRLEVIGDLAAPMAHFALAELLGIPEAIRPSFQSWADSLLAPSEEEHGLLTSPADCQPPAFLIDLLEQRRRVPEADAISCLVAATPEQSLLSETRVVACCRILVEAGAEIIAKLVGNLFLALADHPEFMVPLHGELAPLRSTIEEVIRFLPPVWKAARMTRSEVILAKEHIPAHAPIVAWIVSANRDPVHFVEPERFDITRVPNRHLGFGAGIHDCIGTGLARAVATTTLSQFLQQAVGLTRASAAPLAIAAHPALFGVQSLPIVVELAVPPA